LSNREIASFRVRNYILLNKSVIWSCKNYFDGDILSRRAHLSRYRDSIVNVHLSFVNVSGYAWTITRAGWLNKIDVNKINSDYNCNNKVNNGSLINVSSP
jgi:hypothetical protein